MRHAFYNSSMAVSCLREITILSHCSYPNIPKLMYCKYNI